MNTKDNWTRTCGSGTCIEVRPTIDKRFLIMRDTERAEESIVVPATSWRAFLAAAKNGEFDEVLP